MPKANKTEIHIYGIGVSAPFGASQYGSNIVFSKYMPARTVLLSTCIDCVQLPIA